mmetsp:Transcript_81936/g.264514  ORF Transcript_81936/g.264514 Transcript_81936/m.264514 type:complete len:149 (+) Transcript_81936:167-613(+)
MEAVRFLFTRQALPFAPSMHSVCCQLPDWPNLVFLPLSIASCRLTIVKCCVAIHQILRHCQAELELQDLQEAGGTVTPVAGGTVTPIAEAPPMGSGAAGSSSDSGGAHIPHHVSAAHSSDNGGNYRCSQIRCWRQSCFVCRQPQTLSM